MTATLQDHGGNLDAAIAVHGGQPEDWLDLSTGINPRPYPVPRLAPTVWTRLPDATATQALIAAARRFWRISPRLAVLPANGASALIAAVPALLPASRVIIPTPTYNEHAAAFTALGWTITHGPEEGAKARVIVHPNNPDGAVFSGAALDGLELVVIDESFADIDPDLTLQSLAHRPGVVVLKSFGKFWGLAGIRLGFAIGLPQTIDALARRLGPWAVNGPALQIGTAALQDRAWAAATRARLVLDATRLDSMVHAGGKARLVGGTPLFRLYETARAGDAQAALARHRIWTRVFPYSDRWLRLGLPDGPEAWERVARALADLP